MPPLAQDSACPGQRCGIPITHPDHSRCTPHTVRFQISVLDLAPWATPQQVPGELYARQFALSRDIETSGCGTRPCRALLLLIEGDQNRHSGGQPKTAAAASGDSHAKTTARGGAGALC